MLAGHLSIRLKTSQIERNAIQTVIAQSASLTQIPDCEVFSMRPLRSVRENATLRAMDTNNTADQPGEQPVVAAQEVGNPGAGSEQHPSGDINAMIAGMDSESLMALLDGNPAPLPAVAAETEPRTEQQPAKTSAPESNDAPGEQPAAGEQGTETEASHGPKSLSRLSVRGIPAEQQTMLADALKLVRSGEAADIPSAIRALTGEPETVPAATQTETDETQTQAATNQEPETHNVATVAELKEQLRDLRAQRARAIADFSPDAPELIERVEDLIMEIHRAEISEVEMKAQVATWQQQHEAAIETVESKYAEALGNPNFGEILDALVVAAKANNDPALADPNFIIRFADKAAGMLGINGGGVETPAARPASRPTAPPARASRPVGSSVAPGHSSQARYTPEQISQMIAQAPDEVLLALVES